MSRSRVARENVRPVNIPVSTANAPTVMGTRKSRGDRKTDRTLQFVIERLRTAGQSMRILVVEDEPNTGDYLRKGLTESGFVVDLARTGTDGLHMASEGDYDLVVLDVMLPGIDGWTVLKNLRERKQVPVLFLTARDDVQDRVKGLELGADDYLVKPFALPSFWREFERCCAEALA